MQTNTIVASPSLRRILAAMVIALFITGAPASGEDDKPQPGSKAIKNPYYEKTEWRVWRDDATPIEKVKSLVRKGKKENVVEVTIQPSPQSKRVYPVDPDRLPAGRPYIVFGELALPSQHRAGIWDDVYSSWSGLHGYVRSRWRGVDGSNVTVRGHIMDFVDVGKNSMLRVGVNFVHQSTTGMGHAITNGVMPARTQSFEKLYFADVLVTSPAHASLTDHSAVRSSDLYLAHVPTLFNSVGSSNSETMAITKMVIAGGYLPPDTKLLLKRNGLYPAALLYLWRAALPYDVPYDHELRQRIAYKAVGNRATYPEKYSAAGIDRGDMSLAYHCYDDTAHMRSMVDRARSMAVTPPEAIFTVIDADGGTGVYRMRKSALVLQEKDEDVALEVSTEGCYDLQDRPLSLRWKLLYGNKHTTVERDGEDDSIWHIRVPWDEALPGGRTAIALVANNGQHDSNPAIISVYRKKEDLPGPGLGPKGYRFAGKHANRRPVLLDVQDVYVRRGRTVELPLRAVDPEGFPVTFYRRSGEVGTIDGTLISWRCPKKEPKGAKTITLIASDGTSGNSYAGRQVTLHVEKPALMARIVANVLSGKAPLSVEVSAKESIGPAGKVKYGWEFYAPSRKRKAKAFEKLVQGRKAAHTFDKPGVYEIALTARSGKETDTQTVGVLVTAEDPKKRPAVLLVEGNGVYVASGDETPNAFDHTDFGDTAVGKPVVRRFLVVNGGDAPLTLGRKKPIVLTGAGAKAFKVARRPRTTLEGGGSAAFELRFNAKEAGASTATVEIRAGSTKHSFLIMGVAR